MSLRDEILQDDSFDRQRVDAFNTDRPVYLRELSGADGQFWEDELVQEADEQGNPVQIADYARSRLLVRCLVDEDGRRVLDDEDAELLEKKKPHRVLDSLFLKLMEMSSPEGVELGNLEELAGNSVTGP